LDGFLGTTLATENGHGFRTWNSRSLCRSGSLKKAAKYRIDLVEVQEVRWDKGGTEPADYYIVFYGNENADHHFGTGFFVHKRIISAIRRV
jgi:hypothetical protein